MWKKVQTMFTNIYWGKIWWKIDSTISVLNEQSLFNSHENYTYKHPPKKVKIRVKAMDLNRMRHKIIFPTVYKHTTSVYTVYHTPQTNIREENACSLHVQSTGKEDKVTKIATSHNRLLCHNYGSENVVLLISMF